jgi:hypothetical protein
MILIKTNLLPKGIRGFGGIAPFVIVRPEYADDPTVIEHELVHNRQCRKRWWIGFWLRYLRSKEWRYLYELEAYRASLKHGRPLRQCIRDLYYGYAAHTFRGQQRVKEDLTADSMPASYY